MKKINKKIALIFLVLLSLCFTTLGQSENTQTRPAFRFSEKYVLKSSGFNSQGHYFNFGVNLMFLDQLRRVNVLFFRTGIALDSHPTNPKLIGESAVVSQTHTNMYTFYDHLSGLLFIINGESIKATYTFRGEHASRLRRITGAVVNVTDKGYLYDKASRTLAVIDRNYNFKSYIFINNKTLEYEQTNLDVSYLRNKGSFTLVKKDDKKYILSVDNTGNISYREILTSSTGILALGNEINPSVNVGAGSKVIFQQNTKHLLVISTSGELSSYFLHPLF